MLAESVNTMPLWIEIPLSAVLLIGITCVAWFMSKFPPYKM